MVLSSGWGGERQRKEAENQGDSVPAVRIRRDSVESRVLGDGLKGLYGEDVSEVLSIRLLK